MEHYKVLTGTDKDVLSRDVCSMLADGWYLVGVLEVIVQDGVLRYIQAMAKDAHPGFKKSRDIDFDYCTKHRSNRPCAGCLDEM